MRMPNINFELTYFLTNTDLGHRVARGLGFAAAAASPLLVLSACGGESPDTGPDTVSATYFVDCPNGSVADVQILGTFQDTALSPPATVIEIGCNDGAGTIGSPEAVLTTQPDDPEPNMIRVDIDGTELPGPPGIAYDSSIELTHQAGKEAVVVLHAVGDQSVTIDTVRVVNQTPTT